MTLALTSLLFPAWAAARAARTSTPHSIISSRLRTRCRDAISASILRSPSARTTSASSLSTTPKGAVGRQFRLKITSTLAAIHLRSPRYGRRLLAYISFSAVTGRRPGFLWSRYAHAEIHPDTNANLLKEAAAVIATHNVCFSISFFFIIGMFIITAPLCLIRAPVPSSLGVWPYLTHLST